MPMTNDELAVVLDVLRGSARLSYADADALMLEIARRCQVAGKPPEFCQVTHPHWEGPMICGNRLPCPTHGGR